MKDYSSSGHCPFQLPDASDCTSSLWHSCCH